VKGEWVDIEFDCLPLRSVGPLRSDAGGSPKFVDLIARLREAIARHGTLNSYYVHRARCIFHLTNDPNFGELHFIFQGTILTDPSDERVVHTDLECQLVGETCDWLTEPVVRWFRDTVPHAVRVEFDRYIAAGDLAKTRARLERLRAETEEAGGFLGMDL